MFIIFTLLTMQWFITCQDIPERLNRNVNRNSDTS